MTLYGALWFASWCFDVVGSSSFTVASGALLSGLLSVAADLSHRIIRGAHEMLSLVRTAWLGVQSEVSDGTNSARVVLQPGVRGALQAKYWKAASPGPISGVLLDCRVIVCCADGVSVTRNVGIAVLCDPRELDIVARTRTDFVCSADAAAQCLQEFHLWFGTWDCAKRASAKCLYERGRSMELHHRVAPVTSCLMCTVCSKDLNMVWRRSEDFFSAMDTAWNLEFACLAACSLLVRHHGSHACLQCTELSLMVCLAQISHRFCGGIAFLVSTSVPSHPPAVVLCVLYAVPWFSCGGEFVFLVVV